MHNNAEELDVCDPVSISRRDQSLRELDRIDRALTEWDDRRKGADVYEDNGAYRGKYESQREAVVKEVRGAIGVFRDAITHTPLGGTRGGVFAAFARHDRRLVWLWRAWGYYREKFDQRDDPALAPALRAADEVVWSCYRPFFGDADEIQPAPLPYFSDDYTFRAVRTKAESGEVPDEPDGAGPLSGYFDRLPIPLLKLPPTLATSPWALALIGHEVGHFVQVRAGAPARPAEFAALLRRLAAGHGADGKTAEAWGKWGSEVFADLYAVATMGPWAAWAVAQVELAGDEAMRTRGTSYPPPVARLALMASSAEALGLPGAWEELASAVDVDALAAGSDRAVADVALARSLGAALARESLVGGSTLAGLTGLLAKDYEEDDDPGRSGESVRLADALLAGTPAPVKRQRKSARLAAAGAARAWAKVAANTKADDRERSALAYHEAVFAAVEACYEAGKRAGEQRPIGLPDPGRGLAERLLAAGDDELYR
jgi:hypothetical protein